MKKKRKEKEWSEEGMEDAKQPPGALISRHIAMATGRCRVPSQGLGLGRRRGV